MFRTIVATTLVIMVGGGASLAAAQSIPDQSTLGERLGVSAGTAAAVHAALTEVETEPGFLWGVSADLATSLTADQKAELMSAAPQRMLRQRGEARGERPQRRATETQRRAVRNGASLTDEQRAQMRQVTERFAPQIRELREASAEGTLDPDVLRERRQALRTEMRSAMDAILTDEQREQMREHRVRVQRSADDRGEGERRVRVRVRQSDADRATMEQHRSARENALNLTDAQRQQLREMMNERRQRAATNGQQAARAEMLTQEQREIVQIHSALQRALRPFGNR